MSAFTNYVYRQEKKNLLMSLALSREFMNRNNSCTPDNVPPSASLCLSASISSETVSVKIGLTLLSDRKDGKEG